MTSSSCSRHGKLASTPPRAAWEDYPLLCARNMARTLLNADLDAWPGDVDLEELRLRVAWGQASFDEVRAFVAARLRPLR